MPFFLSEPGTNDRPLETSSRRAGPPVLRRSPADLTSPVCSVLRSNLLPNLLLRCGSDSESTCLLPRAQAACPPPTQIHAQLDAVTDPKCAASPPPTPVHARLALYAVADRRKNCLMQRASETKIEAVIRLQYGDEIPSLSRMKFSGAPRRLLQYGEEIPSLSRNKYNEAPPRSSMWHYGSETTSFSRRTDYDDEIPSLSRNWRHHRSGHCHHPDAHPLSRYQQGASHGNSHSGHNFARTNTNDQLKLAASKHTFTKPRVLNRVVSGNYDYRASIKDKPWRNSEPTMEQVRGPRANRLNGNPESSTKKEKAILSPLVRRDQFNKSDFSTRHEHAKFFMIKSFSEDDIQKGIKYKVWASTPNGNNKLDAAFHDAQLLAKEKGKACPVFLFFSVNTSGQFVGLAEMLGPVDFKKTMDFWKEDKWNGFFPITWHIIKDIPNRLFKHIVLENNNNRIVTFSRDTQEIGLPQGLEMLRIFKDYCPRTSILDDFDFYEEKDNARRAQRGNSESTHQAGFSAYDLSMEKLEGGMENWSLVDNWCLEQSWD